MLVTHAGGSADSVVFNTVMSPNSPYTDGTVSLSYGSPWRLEILKSGCSINGTAVESGHVETWLYTTIKNFMVTCKSSGGNNYDNGRYMVKDVHKSTPVGTTRMTFEDFTFIFFIEIPGAAHVYYDWDTNDYVYVQEHGQYNLTNLVGNQIDVYFYYTGTTTLNYRVIGY